MSSDRVSVDDDETAESSRPFPPTESFRQVDVLAPTVAQPDAHVPRPPGRFATDPSPSDAERVGPEATVASGVPSGTAPSRAVVPTVRAEGGTMLSVRVDNEEGSLDTPRRTGQVLSSPRSTRDYRVDELEEQLRALDARVRLLGKTLDRAGRLVALGLGLLLLLVAASRWL